MRYDVLLKRVDENQYEATALAVPECVAVGASREEALEKARCAIRARLADGEVVSIEIEEPEHPLVKFAGMFENHPMFDAVLADIETHRREVDEAERRHADAAP
jgi:predicted RNase H-like HicB family nuclease